MRGITFVGAVLLLVLSLAAQVRSRRAEAPCAALQQLAAELAVKTAEHMAALRTLVAGAEYQKALDGKDRDAPAALRATVPGVPFEEFARRAMAAAEQVQVDDRAALLVWAALHCQSAAIANPIVERLQKDHLKSKHLLELFENFGVLGRTVDPGKAAAFVAKVMAATPHAQVRAWASFLEARRLQQEGSEAGLAKAEQLLADAQVLAAGTDLADRIAASGSESADRATAPQFEKDNLQIGMPVPEIKGEDADGGALELSGLRGRVLVVVFWGFWCGPCRAMIPHERSLVAKLQDKPFALVGVNSDKDRDTYRSEAEKQGVTWPNFWCGPKGPGGPIPGKWNIKAWPTTFVVDHKGVIRFRNLRGEQLEQVVDQLLAEAQREQTGK